ncbi:MAG: hypothetical protein K8S25_14730 [Alphaproteobacteria bacterium]|nr:hypothetical protein [Alphaproteobacteria bacterium]
MIVHDFNVFGVAARSMFTKRATRSSLNRASVYGHLNDLIAIATIVT